MMSRFSSFVLALLLLVASGQVMAAAPWFSVAAGGPWDTASTWDATSCSVATAVTGVVPAATEVVNICAGTVAVGADTNVVGALKVETASAILAIGAFTASATAISTLNDGTITIAAGGDLVGTNLTTAGTGNVTGTTTGKITLSGALTVGTDTTVAIGAGGTLTIGTNLDNSAGTLTLGTGAILKLADANHIITTPTAPKTFPVVDASLLTGTGKTITFVGAANHTISSLTLPAAAAVGGSAKTVIFKIPDGQTLQLPVAFGTASTATTAGCAAVGTVYAISATGTISLTGAQAAGDNVTCTVPPTAAPSTVSAPIFSTKEKAAVFGQEVK